MQMSIGVEYAFHSLFYMIDTPVGSTIGIKDLAQLHHLSETYLSKIFTKLRKAGIVRSVQGVKGGYELAKKPEAISFWDIVEAIEGASYQFQCAEIRQHNALSSAEDATYTQDCPCLIKVVMTQAEDEMRNFLKQKSLGWLHQTVTQAFSPEKTSAIQDWIGRVTHER